MISDRRHFMMTGAAAWAMLAGCGVAQAPVRVLSPERFGARGDGRSDDTAALQRCLDAAGPGEIVRLREGAVYRIDTNWKPTFLKFGGLRLKSYQLLELNGAELRALPSREVQGAVVQGIRTRGWKIRGPGRITGERRGHLGTAGEWGVGIASFSSTGWEVGGAVEITGCWGDGIYVGTAGPAYSQGFLIDSVRISDCRRNGISVVSGRDGRIRRVDIRDVNGTPPRGGIDLEPDDPARPNRNISIADGRIGGDVQVGIYVTGANEGIAISNMEIDAANSGVLVAHPATGVTVERCRIHSRNGGQEGGAVRTVGDPRRIAGLHIVGNVLTGGGDFVVDIWGDGYRDILVSKNEIRASNRGTQGIARVHHGTFTDNVCVIERNAGKRNDYFVHLQATTHGRNRFRNLSPHAMHSAVRGGRDLGGDAYEGPNLVHRYERI
ncbi:MAG TPA: right-handed parallel beta-helix repeat-containing protein [Allosphingosinicella sp.]|nr:right-handed parallel beta-helix repeat-containing protein [Allosphingosinicella sp.]